VSPTIPRPNMRRAMPILPNGFTLGNLFFGLYAMVAASRGEFSRAGVYVVLGGICDALDGRVARATRSGSRFGEELDSLVDAISFGLAPPLIMYFAVLNKTGWEWMFVFFFTACAVMRLARFNVVQAGRAKTHFQGLPSPAAGLTLATYYWFSQTNLYNEAIIFFTDDRVLADLPWHVMLKFLMVGLSILMISNVPYPAVPTVGFRSVKGILGTLVVTGTLLGVLFLPRQFFFPACVVYVAYGVIKSALLGLLDRVPTGASVFDGDEEEEPGLAASALHPEEAPVGRRRRRRRRRGAGDRPTPTMTRPVEEPSE
jgi:CDP-diacylglycerol--serine O-phosphatidyltransferase